MFNIDTHPLVTVKVETCLGEQIQRVWCAHVVVDAEAEVELPCTDVWWEVSILVAECDAELDEFEQIDITAQCLVVVI